MVHFDFCLFLILSILPPTNLLGKGVIIIPRHAAAASNQNLQKYLSSHKKYLMTYLLIVPSTATVIKSNFLLGILHAFLLLGIDKNLPASLLFMRAGQDGSGGQVTGIFWQQLSVSVSQTTMLTATWFTFYKLELCLFSSLKHAHNIEYFSHCISHQSSI